MIVIDSDILIWILRGNNEIVDQFKTAIIETDGNVFVTPVQHAEIYAGMLPKERGGIERFFETLQTIPFDDRIGQLAGEFMSKYRKSHNVTMADALTASAVRLSGYALWTKNRKHYQMLHSKEMYPE